MLLVFFFYLFSFFLLLLVSKEGWCHWWKYKTIEKIRIVGLTVDLWFIISIFFSLFLLFIE